MKIALLGAESTGKSELAKAISKRLSTLNLPVLRIDEYLREWCEREHRTPEPHEQAEVAHTQMTRILHAPQHTIVVADTTPLMVAIYSLYLFADDSLIAQALAWQKRFDITLLTGLDLPWVADGVRDGPHAQAPVDQLVRQMLHTANVHYQVIYGQGDQRLENALFCIASQAAKQPGELAQRLNQALARHETLPKWTGPCETCGDGECEHRLFTRWVK